MLRVPSLDAPMSRERPMARYMAPSSIASACSAVYAIAITTVIRTRCHARISMDYLFLHCFGLLCCFVCSW